MTEIATLYDDLLPAAISPELLERRYPAMIGLAREVLGVYANGFPLMEIWPVGFRTYNLIVPNFTNIPFSLFGLGPPKDLLGMAMFEASRTAGCAYCTAHSCTFALRRGARPQDVTGDRSEQTTAVARFAEGLSRVPADVTKQDLDKVRGFVSEKDAEWLALGVAMMGFLNKFMDATGIALESGVVSDVGGLLAQTDWKPGKHQSDQAFAASELPPVDNLGTYLRILRMAPAAIRQEARWTKGVPCSWPQAGQYLETRTGYAFPVLSKLTHKRAIRATTTILRDNLDAATSACGLSVKPLVAFFYAAVVGDEEIERAARELAKRHCDGIEDFEALAEFATLSGSAESRLEFLTQSMFLSPTEACCMLLARAAAPSPATPEPEVVALVRKTLEPAQTVEIMTWISVLQLLHRLNVYCGVLGEGEV